MTQRPPGSGSVPPPLAANPAATRFAASLAETGKAEEIETRKAGASDRSLSATLVPLVGLYFIGTGLFGLIRLVETLPRVSSTPQVAAPGSTGSTGWTVASGGFGFWWLVAGAITAASLYAGFRILRSDERGRGAGILLALVGGGFAIASLSTATTSLGVALLAINAFVLWVLLASQDQRR